MAKVPVEIPRVGLVMETARLLRWLKAIGDTIAPGDPLAEIETEKAVVEIEASVTGRLVEILVQPEQTVAVGAQIAWVEDGASEAAHAVAEPMTAPSPAGTSAVPPAAATASAAAAAGLRSSPAARRLAKELGIDWTAVQGTGPGGRIQREDVQKAADARQTGEAEAPARFPLSAMRRAVARAMVLSNATVPQFTVSQAVDCTAMNSARVRLAPVPPSPGPSLSLNDFLLQAVARALLEFPALNGIFVGDPNLPDAHIRPASGTHIGLATVVSDGMLVPVLHNVDRLSLTELARQRADLVERARTGRLRQEESVGATFTISNLGATGPDRFTALLNPPESGILAVGRMRDAPVVRDRTVMARPILELTLTVDHRLADGKLAADFLGRVVQILEGGEGPPG